jgi:Flp pilus assembly protein TadD
MSSFKKTLLISISVVCLIFIAIVFFMSRNNFTETQKSFMQFESGDYETSLNSVNNYLIKNPEDVDALLLKAQILAGTGSVIFQEEEFAQQAIEIADKVLIKDPKNHIALYVKGYANEISNNFVEAINLYKQALIISPNDIWILNQLGHVYELTGDLVTAKDYYEKALIVDSNSDVVLANIARIYWGEGKIDLAKTFLLKVLEISSNNHRRAEVAYALSLIEQDAGNLQEALNYAQKAVSFDSKYPNALVANGWIKFRIITELAKTKEEKEKITQDGITLEKAFGEIQQAVDIYPDQTIAYLAIARMYSRLSNFKPFVQMSLDNYSKALEVVDRDISLMGKARTKLKGEIVLEMESFKKASANYIEVSAKTTLETSNDHSQGNFVSSIQDFIKSNIYIQTVYANIFWHGNCLIGSVAGQDYCYDFTAYEVYINYLSSIAGGAHRVTDYNGYGDTSAYCTNGSWIYCENCFPPPAPVYPACGPAQNIATASQPTTNLCSVGTFGNHLGTGASDGVLSWFWDCVGSNTTWPNDTIWCFAPKIVWPVCGSAQNIPSASQPTTNLCSAGTFGNHPGNDADSWSWDCVGSNTTYTNDTAWCFAPKTDEAGSLSVSCVGSPNPATLDDDSVLVTWVATVVGDYAPYTYSWSGNPNLSGNTSSASTTYSTPGLKTATVTVQSQSNLNASSTVACSGVVGDGAGGDGDGGVTVVRPGPGVCAPIGTYPSIPTEYSQLCISGTPTTPITGNGTLANPWFWICQGISNSEPCTANKTFTHDPNLDCTVSMDPFASSTVKINTKTKWKVQVNTHCPSCLKEWFIDGVSVQNDTRDTFENFFTTVGEKTVSVEVSSTTSSGLLCPATTTVNWTGSVNEI